MKSVLLTVALFLSCVLARNSGIYEDNGSTLTQPPNVEGIDVARRAEAFVPTPTRRITNAERLRRGMPLLPPKRRSGALAPRASCVPFTDAKGIVQVKKASTSEVLGYISKTYDGQNSYTYGPIGSALIVKLGSAYSDGTFMEITAVNGPDAAHPFVGAVGGSAGYNFNPGQLGYTYLSGTGHTAANSPPSFSAGHSIQSLGYNAPAESTIWSIDCLTGNMKGQWTNVDGSQPATRIFYDPSVDFIGLIGDFDKFVSTFPNEGAVLVTLTFIPVP